MSVGEDAVRSAFALVRKRRVEGRCTCKVAAWERIEKFDPTCPFHLADGCVGPILRARQEQPT